MANWLQSRLKAAEDLLEGIDRSAKTVTVPRWDQQDAPKSVGGRKITEQVVCNCSMQRAMMIISAVKAFEA